MCSHTTIRRLLLLTITTHRPSLSTRSFNNNHIIDDNLVINRHTDKMFTMSRRLLSSAIHHVTSISITKAVTVTQHKRIPPPTRAVKPVTNKQYRTSLPTAANLKHLIRYNRFQVPASIRLNHVTYIPPILTTSSHTKRQSTRAPCRTITNITHTTYNGRPHRSHHSTSSNIRRNSIQFPIRFQWYMSILHVQCSPMCRPIHKCTHRRLMLPIPTTTLRKSFPITNKLSHPSTTVKLLQNSNQHSFRNRTASHSNFNTTPTARVKSTQRTTVTSILLNHNNNTSHIQRPYQQSKVTMFHQFQLTSLTNIRAKTAITNRQTQTKAFVNKYRQHHFKQ